MTTHAIVEERRITLQMPIGGGLRKVVELAGRDIHPTLTFANDREVAGAASYQALADNLFYGDWWMPRRIFVTSPGEGDGKTCTAFNLAWALSTHAKSVLLVELDFARPRFRSILGDLRIRYGVDSALRGSVKPGESVFSLGINGLSVAAVRDAMTTRDIKLHLPAATEFIDWASRTYDWIVLDCPPALSPKWNNWFGGSAQPALLVVREQHTPSTLIRKAVHRLGKSLKGVLLNDSANAQPIDTSASQAGDRSDLEPDTDVPKNK
jgi:Mrp family chromosome partitioning ATPase